MIGSVKSVLVSLAVFLFLYATNAFADSGQEPLVHIFCIEKTAAAQAGVMLVADEARWIRMVKLLEKRQTREIPNVEDGGTQACLNQFAEYFKKGEFILGGRETLRKTRLSFSPAESPKNYSKAIPVIPAGVSQPYLSNLLIEGEDLTIPALDEAELNRRDVRYQELWGKFLDGLRNKISSRP